MRAWLLEADMLASSTGCVQYKCKPASVANQLSSPNLIGEGVRVCDVGVLALLPSLSRIILCRLSGVQALSSTIWGSAIVCA